ncbi:hypothetical protein GCK72_009297 [Caenorhabditis remanei]|uniref:TIL domain-containing protein n=1 Tax=Caenorhabditis remanei TaxID=31234 RepID=A0A6A5H3D5_CAERE|nr:hypothetical protein GCK72_009297 [Caenorhabditis remanei]KAF1761043.1 hypothetical protein GCK72_009297 [Caenorhabditis remanei]
MNAFPVFFFILISTLIPPVASGTVKRAVHSSGCPKNAEYKECTNICPDKSCQNYLMVSTCFSLRCGPPACICKEGHVYLDGEDKNQGCVRRETCNRLNKIRNQPVP